MNKKIDTIEVRGPDIQHCEWAAEKCDQVATAFLQKTRKFAGRKEVTTLGYCVEHAKKIHDSLLENQNYKVGSFEKPNKL